MRRNDTSRLTYTPLAQSRPGYASKDRGARGVTRRREVKRAPVRCGSGGRRYDEIAATGTGAAAEGFGWQRSCLPEPR